MRYPRNRLKMHDATYVNGDVAETVVDALNQSDVVGVAVYHTPFMNRDVLALVSLEQIGKQAQESLMLSFALAGAAGGMTTSIRGGEVLTFMLHHGFLWIPCMIPSTRSRRVFCHGTFS